MGLAINLFERSACRLHPVQIVVQDHTHHIIKCLDWHVAARLAPPASWASHHSKQVRGVLKLAEPCRCCRSLRPLGASFFPMDGMQRGNMGFACFGLGASAPPSVRATFLFLARLKCRSPALGIRAIAFGSAAKALDSPVG